MQTVLAIVIVALAVGYLGWLWMPRRKALAVGEESGVPATPCESCFSCSGCAN